MPFDPVQSRYLSLPASFVDDLLDSRITRNHAISHPNDVLRRLVTSVTILTVSFSIFGRTYLHLARRYRVKASLVAYNTFLSYRIGISRLVRLLEYYILVPKYVFLKAQTLSDLMMFLELGVPWRLCLALLFQREWRRI